MRGISAYGVYLPWRRLNRAAIASAHEWYAPGLKALGRGERAIAHWDEDPITMATEASRACVSEAEPSAITLASTSLPFKDRLNAGVVKEALNLDDSTRSMDATGSWRAATGALLQAFEGGEGVTLCVAAEKARPAPMSEMELTLGDGASAFMISQTDVIAELVASESVSVDFVDHFQAVDADAPYTWEARWIRDEGYAKIIPRAFTALCKKSGIDSGDIAHFAFGSPMRGVSKRIAKKLRIPDSALDDEIESAVGFVGAAHPFVALAAALEKAAPGELILVGAFGGGCDLILLRATDNIAKYRSASPLSQSMRCKNETENYLQYLTLNGLLKTDQGMRAEQDQKTPLTALYRDRKSVYGLVGGKCVKTGAVQFPKSNIAVGENSWDVGTQEDYPLADIPAHIVTYTEDRLAFTPCPPYAYGTIEFEGGGRMVAEFADYPDGALAVGAPVRMVFRIKTYDHQRNFKRYFWKAVPATAP